MTVFSSAFQEDLTSLKMRKNPKEPAPNLCKDLKKRRRIKKQNVAKEEVGNKKYSLEQNFHEEDKISNQPTSPQTEKRNNKLNEVIPL